jgi:hypothetical protein
VARQGRGHSVTSASRSPYPIRPYGPPPRWSRRRKLRLARTGAILLTLIILIWLLARSCGSDTVVSTSNSTTTTRPRVTTTTASPVTLTAAKTPRPLPAPHYDAPAVDLGGKELIMGGLDRNRSSKTAVWSFDPATGMTTTAGVLARSAHGSAAAAIGGKVFVFGGSIATKAFAEIQEFDPATRTSKVVGRLPSARTDFTAVTDPSGPMTYLVGGWDGKQPATQILSTLDGTTFQPVAALPEPVVDPAVVLAGSTIWVFGGSWNDVASASIQKIDIVGGNAQVVGKMSSPISNAMAFAIDGSVFLAGGKVDATRSSDVSHFDPATSTLTPVAKLPAGLSDSSVSVSGATAYLFGGLTPRVTSQILTLSSS